MQNKKGFTIIELIVVIAIITVLASIVAVNVAGYINKAKAARIASEARNVQSAMEMYYAQNGYYPLYNNGTDTDRMSCNSGLGNTGFYTDLNPLLVPTFMGSLPTFPSSDSTSCSAGYWEYETGSNVPSSTVTCGITPIGKYAIYIGSPFQISNLPLLMNNGTQVCPGARCISTYEYCLTGGS